MNHIVSSSQVTFETLKIMLDPTTKLALSEESKAKIKSCRDYLDKKMESSDAASMVLILDLDRYITSLFQSKT